MTKQKPNEKQSGLNTSVPIAESNLLGVILGRQKLNRASGKQWWLPRKQAIVVICYMHNQATVSQYLNRALMLSSSESLWQAKVRI